MVVMRVLDDVGVEVLGREGLDLFLQLGRGGLTRRLLLAEEDGRVTVDPVLQRLEAVVALVNDRLEFAAMKKFEHKQMSQTLQMADVRFSTSHSSIDVKQL